MSEAVFSKAFPSLKNSIKTKLRGNTRIYLFHANKNESSENALLMYCESSRMGQSLGKGSLLVKRGGWRWVLQVGGVEPTPQGRRRLPG